MFKTFDFFRKYVAEIMLGFLILYATLPFLSPILFYFDSNSKIAIGIQNVYKIFCHQRPQSSLFLFGGENSKYFYTLEELQNLNVVPQDSKVSFGTGYWGNSEVGYKVAYCIRDVGIYTALVLMGLFLMMFMNFRKKIIKIHWSVILLFMLPMIIDGVIQFLVMIFEPAWITEIYLFSMLKKFLTGVLFGFGCAFLIFPNLKEASNLGYNKK